MTTTTVKTFELDEKEIKEAIRKHLIDKLGTLPQINDCDIELFASISMDDNPYDFTAKFTSKTSEI